MPRFTIALRLARFAHLSSVKGSPAASRDLWQRETLFASRVVADVGGGDYRSESPDLVHGGAEWRRGHCKKKEIAFDSLPLSVRFSSA